MTSTHTVRGRGKSHGELEVLDSRPTDSESVGHIVT